jgi:hypothetical protein
MDNSTWEALSATPLPEVRRRAGVLDALLYPARERPPGATRYNWEDFGGQWTKWLLPDVSREVAATLGKWSRTEASFGRTGRYDPPSIE